MKILTKIFNKINNKIFNKMIIKNNKKFKISKKKIA